MADAYWRTQVTDIDPTLFPDLTGASSSARAELLGFNVVEHTLDRHISSRASAATHLAACAKVLALYTGEDDLCLDYIHKQIGISDANRISTALPLRVTIAAGSETYQIVAQIEDKLSQAHLHGCPSPAVLHEALPPDSVWSNTLVVINEASACDTAFVIDERGKYDIILEFTGQSTSAPRPQVIRLHFRSSFLLAHDTQHLLAALDDALRSASSHPFSTFLSWTTNSTLQPSVTNLKHELAECPHTQVVHVAFEQHTLQHPDKISLEFLEEDGAQTSWTFTTLNQFANQIANTLIQDYDIQIEDSVPICVSKSPAFYACVLGVLKAGANFTPFSGLPPERQRYMLQELGSKVLLHSDGQDLSWCSEALKLNVTALIEISSCSARAQNPKLRSSVQPSHLCYQMYTSGSTGRPKAVSLEHRNAVQTACATRELIPWVAEDRMLQQAGVNFDMCYFETFFAWTTGIRLCSAPDSLIYNKLSDVINDMNVSLLGSTPSVALTLDPESLPNLKWMYCIGEALPQSLVDSWEGRLVNSYGPTETAQMVTLFPVSRKVKSTIIGKPFRNTSFTILQRHGTETVPIFGVGELCVGGHQVARGYHRKPEKTMQAFITLAGQRLYRTGDMVRMLGDGNTEFIGRVDDQVKVRGQRVELGEIDKALQKSHRAIISTCTQILKVNDQSKGQLVAFMVLDHAVSHQDQSQIRYEIERHLTDILPAYMIPKLFLFIKEIPLTTSGKLDKRALTQILRQSDQVKTATLPGGHEMSQEVSTLIQQIYSQLSGVPTKEISPDMSIYQLGIDSISAIQIAHHLTSKGFRVQASDVMRNSTISTLSSLLRDRPGPANKNTDDEDLTFDYENFDKEHRSSITQKYGIAGTKIASVRPASPLQSSLIAQSVHSSGGLYFNHLKYRLPSDLDVQKFLDAWEALVSKHEILRSGFVLLDKSIHPVAMVTFHARSQPSPIHLLQDEEHDPGDLHSVFVRDATQQIFMPPWQVLLSQAHDHFYFSAHHALYDAQVLEILMRDLALAYDGQRLPNTPHFERHLTQRLFRSESQHKSDTEFWKAYGAKAMPSNFPLLTPVLDDNSGICVAKAVAPKSLTELEQGCRAIGVSMQAAAQAAWGQLLGALTGESVVTFGTVLSGRNVKDSAEVAFPMITTVPTVFDVRVTSIDALQALMGFNADLQNHQFVSLTKIQDLMGYAGESLFDTIFTFQKRTHHQVDTDTIFEFCSNDLDIEYPVSVEVEPTKMGQLECSLYYQSGIMRREQANLLVDQFLFLLCRIVFANACTSALTVKTADKHLFSIMPATYEYLPSECSLLHHSVEMTAREQPHKTALEFVTELDTERCETLSWSFQELDEAGNRIAHLLQERGVERGSLVAICFEKCPEAAFAMLGISKAGCGFLALDTGAPIERKKFIVQDSQASILFSKPPHARDLDAAFPNQVVDLAAEDISTYPSSQVRLGRPIDPQEVAYCLYTSGTSGTPKGCLVTHENVIQVFMCFDKLYEHDEGSRWMQFASYHFDVSVMEHFWSWFVGMTVVTASRDLVLQDLAGAITTLNISHIDLTPSLARLLDPKVVPSLARGVFVTGGEMLRRDIIEAWGDSGAIHNAYGPTEATIGVTMYRKVPKNGRPSNIGWPFQVVGVFVTQPSNPEVPVLRGGVGELLVYGKLVAKGYLRREQLTKERFINVAGQKCYRTGDLVRILSDGSIDFLGRIDDQVKLRGQRLETGEINSVIKQRNTEVDDVCTLVLKHPKQQKEQLVSFISLRDSAKEPHELSLCNAFMARRLIPDLRAGCAKKLPGYMIPTHMLLVNTMPLSANNKIEAKQLRALYGNTDIALLQSLVNDGEHEFTGQMNEEDTKFITGALSSTLGIEPDKVSLSANFFELGLDSVSVINLSRALRAVGYNLASPSLIMKNVTVAKLGAAICKLNPQDTEYSVRIAKQDILACRNRYMAHVMSLLSIRDEEVETLMPCTSLQVGMIARSLESTRGLYFTAFSFDLDNEVDTQRLQQACQLVCNHIQVLRTKFVQTDESFVQVVLRNFAVPWVEMETNIEQEVGSVLKKARLAWCRKNEDSFVQPFEIVLLKTPQSTILTFHIFHGLYDGNSLPLIMDAISSEYNGKGKTKYGPSFSECLPYGPIRRTEDAQNFWIDHLAPLADLQVSSLKPMISARAEQDTYTTYRIDPIEELEHCRRRLNVTHQAILQACWAVLLQDIMSGPLVLGLIVSGRSIDFEGADSVIGPLFNTIPFLLPLYESDTWRNVITRSHEFSCAALTYQHTPLRDIQKWTCQYRNGSSLFETLFVFQKEDVHKTTANTLWTPREENSVPDYPLAFEVMQTADGGFDLTLACQAHISDERSSRSLLQRFDHILARSIRGIDTPICEFVTNHALFERGCGHGKGNNTAPNNEMNHEDKISRDSTQVLSEAAKQVQRVMADVASVGLDQIRATTSIFELGLDSIDAVKLSSGLKKETGVHLPVSQIMRLLTLERIVATVEEKGPSSGQRDVADNLKVISSAIEKALHSAGSNSTNIESILPCTPLQESMVANMLTSNFDHYLNFDVLKLRKDTDTDILKTAWLQLMEACPILRTRFVEIDDPSVDCTVAQVVMASSTVQFDEVEVQSEPDFMTHFSNIRNDVRETYSVRPASRLTLVRGRKDDNERYMILTLPHAMYDGWSLGLIHSSVRKFYHGERVVLPSYEPALSDILSCAGQSSTDFWRQKLKGVKTTLFPSSQNDDKGTIRKEVSSQMPVHEVSSFCRQNKVTVAALCQCVWSIVLAQYTQQLDVAFGQVMSGRTEEAAEAVIFPTMNTVISRSELQGSRLEMLGRAQEGLSNALGHQHFPLRKAMSFVSNRGVSDLFNTLFIFQRSVGTSDDSVQPYESVASASNVEYPVCVEAELTDTSLIWRTACEGSYLSELGVETLLKDLDEVCKAVVKQPARALVERTGDQIRLCSLHPIPAPIPVAEPAEVTPDDKGAGMRETWSLTEQAIREVVANVAKLDPHEVSKQSSLPGLGLDSISTIKLSSLLRRRGLRIGVNEILGAGTIENIAQQVDKDEDQPNVPQSRRKDAAANRVDETSDEVVRDMLDDVDIHTMLSTVSIDNDNVERVLPATSGQMLLLSRWQNEGAYYSSLDFSASGCGDVEKLRSAWSILIGRSPMLRTFFLATGRQDYPVLQITLKNIQSNFREVELGTALDEEADRVLMPASSMPRAPCALFAQRTEDGRFNLALKISHALYDGFSLKILIATFQDLVNGSPLSTAPTSYTFSNYIAGVAQPLPRRHFWTTYLSGLKTWSLPSKDTSSNITAPKRLHIVKTDVLKRFSSLRDIGRKHHVSIQSLLLASYSVTHARMLQRHDTEHTDVDDVLIGVFMANRNIEGSDELAAPTLSFTPVRVRHPLSRSLTTIAQAIQADMRDISEHGRSQVGLWELQEWIGNHVKVDVWVNLLRQWVPDASDDRDGQVRIITGEKSEDLETSYNIRRCDEEVANGLLLKDNAVRDAYDYPMMDLEVTVKDDNLDIGIQAPTTLIDFDAARRIIEDVSMQLDHASADADAEVDGEVDGDENTHTKPWP